MLQAGIVDQDVKAPGALKGGYHERCARIRRGDVRGHGPSPRQVGGDPAGAFRIQVSGHNSGARRG